MQPKLYRFRLFPRLGVCMRWGYSNPLGRRRQIYRFEKFGAEIHIVDTMKGRDCRNNQAIASVIIYIRTSSS